MDLKPVQAFLDFLKSDASWFLSTWYAVITKGAGAFAAVDLNKADTLLHAFRFLFYIAVFGFVLEVPVAALLKFPYDKPAFVASSLALTCILWLGYAVILHGAMKAFGGRGELQQSLAIFCFSTAWFIPVMVLQWPLLRYVVPTLAGGEIGSTALLTALSPMEAITFASLGLTATVLLAYFLVVVFKALREAHQLARARALSALFFGIVGVVVIVFLFSLPMHTLLYSAFK